ncbi:hypothetical protein FRACYDRAFT_235552 [Fragilariopsis cylindrus CCMP1102]|uniref:CRAL-TRIO domain-containing protein n=1 Tax=Fragilariopsis cylindrus CCMP1102 TaxID=635003 RepID=A0A1E7FN29_9STRA|nr:hypothetical protein FRACYDRAFT_235552 [Fragilariopsis cylindrus CCMP1102]|eukprot:OEU19495.1 hypothetical protein FRACYDRAFT_235552 [Fragilariopsis cylindrus CCMP1102]
MSYLSWCQKSCDRVALYNDDSSVATDLDTIYKQAPARIETPALIKNSILEFDTMIDNISNVKKKANYLLAKESCSATGPGGCEACYDTFKLTFLRCESFNTKLAVKRWLKYWDSRVETFGLQHAFLPMTMEEGGAMHGIMTMDSPAMKYLQYSPVITDPDGRGILFQDMWVEADTDISADTLLKVVWYQIHQLIQQQDESVQQHGIIIYVRGVTQFSDWNIKLSGKLFKHINTCLPIRICGFHIINPLSFINVVLKIIRPLAGKKLRNSFHIHNSNSNRKAAAGEKDDDDDDNESSIPDLLVSLSKFGLGTNETLPTILGGTLIMV